MLGAVLVEIKDNCCVEYKILIFFMMILGKIIKNLYF